MANNRDFKKAIKTACSVIAGECIMAQEKDQKKEWDSLVIDAALVQQEAVNRTSVKFDKKPAEFANGREYRRARRAFFKGVEKEITEYMRQEVGEIAKKMNDLR